MSGVVGRNPRMAIVDDGPFSAPFTRAAFDKMLWTAGYGGLAKPAANQGEARGLTAARARLMAASGCMNGGFAPP